MELDKEKLLKLYNPYTSVLGPYVRKDGRKHVVLNNSSLTIGAIGKTKTISFPKALVEVSIGKKLLPNETVDHFDRDFTNNSLNNLVVVDRSIHISEDALRVTVEEAKCPICNTPFIPNIKQRNKQRTEPNAGPFCSRSCIGIYGTKIQKGEPALKQTEIKKKYFYIIKKKRN